MASDQVFIAALSLQGSLYVLLPHTINGGLQNGRCNRVEYSQQKVREEEKNLKLALHSQHYLISDCHNHKTQSARGKCFGSTILAQIHMVVEKMHTQERAIATKTIITTLVVTTTALISLIITWGPKSLKSYGISQKKTNKLNWTIE